MKHWYRDTVFSHIAQPYNGVVYIAYQFEPGWDAEDISEEDHAEPLWKHGS